MGDECSAIAVVSEINEIYTIIVEIGAFLNCPGELSTLSIEN